MTKNRYLCVNEIYDSGILSTGPAIIYTKDGKPVRTSDDQE
jgi:hypothetical protein